MLRHFLILVLFFVSPVSYTSDAADDLLCVDLVGRRIIKKKNTNIEIYRTKLMCKIEIST